MVCTSNSQAYKWLSKDLHYLPLKISLYALAKSQNGLHDDRKLKNQSVFKNSYSKVSNTDVYPAVTSFLENIGKPCFM